jgi:phosphotransferase system  glucose/maltose/N-acetylglucosamine-specific IIC component
MADLGYAMGGIIFILLAIGLLVGLGVHNAQTKQQINCPFTPEQIKEYISGNSSNIFSQFGATVGILITPCSGIPWWIGVIFLIIVIGIVVWLTPLVGG